MAFVGSLRILKRSSRSLRNKQSVDKPKSPLEEAIEKAAEEDRARLGNIASGCPLLTELDEARRLEEEVAKIEKDPMRLLTLFDEIMADAEIKRVLDRIKGAE